MRRHITYGSSAEMDRIGEVRNGFTTLNLGDGLWVNVPNLVIVRANELRPLYRFNLRPDPMPSSIRIVGRHITPRGQVLPESNNFLGTDGFVPKAGHVLHHSEYPNVIAGTFFGYNLYAGTTNVEALAEEQSKAIEDGWLCSVAETPRDIMPGRLALSSMDILQTGYISN